MEEYIVWGDDNQKWVGKSGFELWQHKFVFYGNLWTEFLGPTVIDFVWELVFIIVNDLVLQFFVQCVKVVYSSILMYSLS